MINFEYFCQIDVLLINQVSFNFMKFPKIRCQNKNFTFLTHWQRRFPIFVLWKSWCIPKKRKGFSLELVIYRKSKRYRISESNIGCGRFPMSVRYWRHCVLRISTTRALSLQVSSDPLSSSAKSSDLVFATCVSLLIPLNLALNSFKRWQESVVALPGIFLRSSLDRIL